MADLGIYNTLFLEPMLDSYLSSERVNQMWETGNAAHLWMFGGVTLLILLIACANFANIATAQATDRTMEAGVRKSLGATPGQLARLFLGETGLTVAVSVGLGTFSAADSAFALILNETAVEHFEFASPEAAIGASFDQLGRSGTVIGVVEDYHYQSLHDPIGPLSLRPLQSGVRTISLKLAAGSLPGVMDEVRVA